ncbi:L-dopachrome tautomerase-related protein [Komagataeibacter rhaeticus]|nr:L-dopachrome tautomerase-related protein [Komagataeibacter rhaeticus]
MPRNGPPAGGRAGMPHHPLPFVPVRDEISRDVREIPSRPPPPAPCGPAPCLWRQPAGHAACRPCRQTGPPLNPPAALEDVASSSTSAWDRVAVLPDGRLLVELPRWAGNNGPALAVLDAGGNPQPYPDATWNDPAAPPSSRFVAPSDMQLQPDGTLWVLDSGQPDPTGRPLEGGPKIVKLDTHGQRVLQTWPLNPDMLRPGSYAATMRVARGHAFVGDAGVPAMIVVKLDTNTQRRLMEHTPALTAHQPITVDGKVATNPAGHTAIVNISQMDISADGQWLYFEPLCGPVYKLDTDLLVDPKVTPIELEEGPTLWYKTPRWAGLPQALMARCISMTCPPAASSG